MAAVTPAGAIAIAERLELVVKAVPALTPTAFDKRVGPRIARLV